MAIYEHIDTFAGLEVEDWSPGDGPLQPDTLYRIGLSYSDADNGELWSDQLDALLDQPGAEQLRGIVVGPWHNMFEEGANAEQVVEALVAARDRLPNLRAIFFGDIISEECEISWIQNTDLSPLLTAYPELEYLTARGGNGLTFGAIRHASLRELVIQAGGLDARTVREAAGADLPALEHLELWLGTENYGGNARVADLAALLDGSRFPRLRSLGLRNSDISDAIAVALVSSPLLERVEVLDLSLGTLGDEGAQALLEAPAVRRLRKLDIHHHYCSEAMVERLAALGVELDASEAGGDGDGDESDRYVAVGE